MVASLVPAADRAVNLGRHQLLRQICTEEHVVEAQAAIAPACVPETIPERVDALLGVHVAQRVRSALRDDHPEGPPNLGAKQRIVCFAGSRRPSLAV